MLCIALVLETRLTYLSISSTKMKTSLWRFLILIALWAFCFQLSVGFVWSQCLEDQQAVLIQLKESLTFNSTLARNIVTWNSSTDCCTWSGVTCNSDGHVSRLDLHNNHLSGSIVSTNWSDLSNLTSIDLGNNSLTGAIPASLFAIPSLQQMDLHQNQFTGRLDELSGGIASSALQGLYLSENGLEGPISTFISRHPSLQYLDLSSNNFSGPINLHSLQQLRDLTEINLSNNSLWINESGINATSLPQIEIINLASCQLTRFPTFLKEQSQLDSLDLSNNQMAGEIPHWIWSLEDLYILDLSHNMLESYQEPANGFMSIISYLDLSWNKLQGRPPQISPFASYVDFSNNNFSSVIPVDLEGYVGITEFISLANNNIRGSIPESICRKIPFVVNLSNNSLTGTIPQCLFGGTTLMVLNLRGNKLSGNIPDTFSSSGCGLKTLDLNGNQLEGKIPKSLAHCSYLEVLDLGNNQLRGTFPCHLKSLSTLRVLVLRSNHFQGPISCSKGKFSWELLQIVDFASNNFSGVLPIQCLRTWKAMMHGKDDGVRHVRINTDNDYSPMFDYQDSITVTTKGVEFQLVKILSIFTFIDLSCNNFEGKIPDVMSEFKALYVLNLSHNSFTSRIPSFLGNLRNLESLDLSSNNLSGKIPQQLADLNFLEVLNLSHNQLEGRIPSGNQFQTFSEDSFADNKGLCGAPLKENCSLNAPPPPGSFQDKQPEKGIHINWRFLSVELGFVFGLGIVILPLMFWKRWRIWYYTHVDVLLYRFFPQWNQGRRNRGRRISRRTVTRTQLRAGEVALQPRVSKLRKGRRTGEVVVV